MVVGPDIHLRKLPRGTRDTLSGAQLWRTTVPRQRKRRHNRFGGFLIYTMTASLTHVPRQGRAGRSRLRETQIATRNYPPISRPYKQERSDHQITDSVSLTYQRGDGVRNIPPNTSTVLAQADHP